MARICFHPGTRTYALLALAVTGTLALAACPEPDVTGPVEVPDPVFSWSMTPETVDFGEVSLHDTGRAEIRLANTGTAQLVVGDITLPDGVRLASGRPGLVPPSSATLLQLRWEPELSGFLAAPMTVELGPGADDMQLHEVPLQGYAAGPNLVVSLSDYDFGVLDVGCEEAARVTVTNAGGAPLTVTSVNLGDDDRFSLHGGSDLLGELGPFESREVEIRFAPRDLAERGATLTVETTAGDEQVWFTGQGAADEVKTEEVALATVGAKTTVLFHLNTCVIPGTSEADFFPWVEPFTEALPTFFETLQATDNRYRIGFLYQQTGVMDDTYITDEMSPSAAAAFVYDNQMSKSAGFGDNDASLRTLMAGVDVNRDWLLEEGGWDEAPLHLVAINRDQEQSGIPANTAVTAVNAIKRNGPSVWHAIAGPPTTGCSPWGEGFDGYKPAIDLTGGSFQSICEEDWEAKMEKLALAVAASIGSSTQDLRLPLRGIPVSDTIEVRVDGARLPAGWRYDERLNAVILDSTFRVDGENMVVTYTSSSTCGG